MIRKSLICFCSGTPGGRVRVVKRMIGCVFVTIWAFCGDLGPLSHRSFFCYCLLLLVVVVGKRRQFLFLLERRHCSWQQEDKEDQEDQEGKTLNHIWKQERG